MEGASDPRIGETVGSYKIESVLGVGGMGHVYRGIGPDGEAVAVKLVKQNFADDPTFRKRFEREARIAQQVSHEHLVPVLDAGDHGGVPYLVQRYVGNGTLADRIEQGGPRPIDQIVEVVDNIAGALD